MELYIVLLNWNGWRDTIKCLESILMVTSLDFSIIVCDNASSDNSLIKIKEWLNHHYPTISQVSLTKKDVILNIDKQISKVFFIDNEDNLGFAGGNNPGIHLAINDPDCRYIWLLNNDTIIQPSTLSEAVNRMEQDPSIGICGSTLVYFHDRDRVQAFGGAIYSPWTGRSRHIGAFASPQQIPITPKYVEQQMTYVVGASMLVRREFIEQVGFMQEDYFLYYEEIDWAIRGKGQFRLGYAPKSIVFHKEGASIGTSSSGGSPLSLFYLFRNRVRYAWRFHRIYMPSILFFCALDIVKLAVRRRWVQAAAAVRGLLQLSRPQPVVKSR